MSADEGKCKSTQKDSGGAERSCAAQEGHGGHLHDAYVGSRRVLSWPNVKEKK